jgi:hypothetical protein
MGGRRALPLLPAGRSIAAARTRAESAPGTGRASIPHLLATLGRVDPTLLVLVLTGSAPVISLQLLPELCFHYAADVVDIEPPFLRKGVNFGRGMRPPFAGHLGDVAGVCPAPGCPSPGQADGIRQLGGVICCLGEGSRRRHNRGGRRSRRRRGGRRRQRRRRGRKPEEIIVVVAHDEIFNRRRGGRRRRWWEGPIILDQYPKLTLI